MIGYIPANDDDMIISIGYPDRMLVLFYLYDPGEWTLGPVC